MTLTVTHLVGFGSSALWTPAVLGTGVLGWFDASIPSTVTITGSGVSNWASRLGSMTAVQATDANRPTYTSGQYVDFSDTGLLHLDVANGVDGYDYAVVGTPRGANGTGGFGYRVWFSCAADPDNNGPFTLLTEGASDGNPVNDLGVYSGTGGGMFDAGSLEWATDELAQVYGFVPTAADVFIGKNGDTLQDTNSGALPDTTIVAFGRAAFAQPPGRVHEIIIMTHNQSVDVRNKVQGYLAHKWALAGSLPATHPYKNSPPTV